MSAATRLLTVYSCLVHSLCGLDRKTPAGEDALSVIFIWDRSRAARYTCLRKIDDSALFSGTAL